MHKILMRSCLVFAVLLSLVVALQPARADDTEIFFGNRVTSVPANILLTLDTSGSMATQIETRPDYDPTRDYTGYGTCSDSYVYYGVSPAPVDGNGDPVYPTCNDTSVQIAKARFLCSSATSALAFGAGQTGLGYYSDKMIRWGRVTSTTSVVDPTIRTSAACALAGGSWSTRTSQCTISTTSTSYAWQPIMNSTNASDIDCYRDRPGTGADRTYPTKISSTTSTTSGVYTSVATDSWWSVSGNTGGNFIVYSANFLNYYYNSGLETATRLSAVQGASTGLLNLLSGVNVGLMTYSYDASGGMMRSPVQSIDATGVRASMTSQIRSLVPAGNTPLSETLFEAYQYFSGGRVVFGGNGTYGDFRSTSCTTGSVDITGAFTGGCDASDYFPSVASSQSSAGTYDSPADYSCQKNYIIYLTDGEPTADNQADSYIEGTTTTTSVTVTAANATVCAALGGTWSTRRNRCTITTTVSTGGLPNFQSVTGGCVGSGSGRCLSALSKYLYSSDLRSDVTGTQNVKTYYIGFGSDFAGSNNAAFAYLQTAATAGGGQAYSASNYSSLSSVFASIAQDIADDVNVSFSAPTVAVNAFNRTQTLDDLYVSVFVPETTIHWPGNLKKYKVTNEVVVDGDGRPAVNPATGFFKDGSRSFWSVGADGPDVTLGGAARKFPDYDSRNVYTYLGTNKPSSSQSLTDISAAITDANAPTVLGLTTGDPTRADLVNWAKGLDVKGDNPASDTSGMRHAMGDPVHSEPGVVIYDRGSGTGYTTVVFVTTNDGYLHAVEATAATNGSDTTTSGVELWSFIPQELLPDLRLLYANDDATTKHYGLDGPVRILKYDVDGDGVIEPADGDKVILYFTTGRNTAQQRYYALDVTDRTTPKFMWSINGSDLPGLGQSWSSPVITRVTVGSGSGQNGQRLVLIFGGGYDASEDGFSYVTGDGSGNHLYMVDAKSGALLWKAGPSGGYDFTNARMTHAFSSSVTVLDVDNNGFADRMYVGDMAGQVWRFDIINGQSASNLVRGGVMASLGSKEETTHTLANTRRFYAAPDVALIQPVGSKAYFNIAIGSGYRGHPLNTQMQDRMYAIRDYNPYNTLTAAQYTAAHLIVDSELTDITTMTVPTVATGAYGWKMQLNQHTGGWIGEKVVTSARTLNNVLYFTTYVPGADSTTTTDPCATSHGTGVNYVYQVNALNGSAVVDHNGDGTLSNDERSTELKQGGIAPGISLLFPGNGSDDVLVMSGPEVVGTCDTCRSLRKTYWFDATAD